MVLEEKKVFMHKGMKIVGILTKPEELPPWPTVIMLHAYSSNKNDNGKTFPPLARALAEKGYASFRFDFRYSKPPWNAPNESDGYLSDIRVSEWIDDALFVAEQFASKDYIDYTRLGYVGISLGGFIGLYAAALSETISYVVAASASIEPYTPFIRLGFREENDGSMVLRDLRLRLSREAVEELKSYSIFDVIRKLRDKKVFLIYGERDTITPPEDGIKICIALGENCELKIIDNANHRFATLEHVLVNTIAQWIYENI